MMEAMKIEVSEEDLALIVESLEHFFAYTRAAQREDPRYQVLANQLRLIPAPQGKARPKKKL